MVQVREHQAVAASRPGPAVLTWLRLARVFQKVRQASEEQFREFGLSLAQFFRLQQVGSVEIRALLHADVDEGGLDAAQYRFDAAEIDVAYGPAMIRAIDQQFDEAVVLEDGNSGLAGGT